MTYRRPRWRALLLVLFLVLSGVASGTGVAGAAHARGIKLFASVGDRDVNAGGTASVWVHTMALANVTLTAAYGNGQTVTERGTTDSAGQYLFRWTADYSGAKVTLARFWVHARRGALSTAARGNFVLFPAPPLHVRVQVLTPSIRVGDTLRVQVSSRPHVALALSVRGEDGHQLISQAGRTDARGGWIDSVPISATIALTHELHVVVTGSDLGRQASVVQYFTLAPAPPSQVSLLAGIPVPAAVGASPEEARKLVRAAAAGSFTTAQTDARAAVQAITADLQVLAQWTSVAAFHDVGYYQDLLARATTYDAYIDATAQALVDDAPIEARMRAVMPSKAIMVSIGEQALRAYQNGQLVMSTYVTTGRPELPTVTGHYAIYEKVTPFEFISPWPMGSPFYYEPTWIKYWMPFYSGYGLHDAWWRAHYGPGTNITGDGPGSSEPTGTHGCVNIPFANTQWLWDWAPVGTPVVVYGGPYVAPGAAAGI